VEEELFAWIEEAQWVDKWSVVVTKKTNLRFRDG
jgi:hypothetical protein